MKEDISSKALKKLERAAARAAQNSYAPYSNFRVGAALLSKDGIIFTGSNVENRSYGLTICAERAALFSAISQNKNSFKALFIIGIDTNLPLPPCGACRQVLSEFVNTDFPVYFCGRDRLYIKKTMGELIPFDALHELKK